MLLLAFFTLAACEPETILASEETLPTRSVQIVNGRDDPILYFYTTPSKVRNWGYDHIGNGLIPPGRARTITFTDSSLCTYDFLVEFDRGEDIDERKINICQISQWVAN